ncbi:hypothetical protein EYF80_061950 [Liparis tanakae]|uniref:Uncharacterized protein n=1 Tax=Liparis tanakae TaxID=230148 RepID=A0A4Z2EGJ7_9TELE|nr:hypothetical protein EYF80_061950 [Liparis tanakae]
MIGCPETRHADAQRVRLPSTTQSNPKKWKNLKESLWRGSMVRVHLHPSLLESAQKVSASQRHEKRSPGASTSLLKRYEKVSYLSRFMF